MTALQHIYLSAHGEWTTPNWLGEKAQIGLRLAIVAESGAPAKGAVFTLPESGDIVLDSGTTAGTHGTLSRTWTARRGPVGSSENCDAAFQVDLAEDFWTFLDSMKADIKDTFRWTHIKISGVTSAGNIPFPSATYQFTTPLAGTNSAGTNFPPEVAVAVSLRANVVGRAGRGRFYVPGLCTSVSASDGTVSSTARTNFASRMATLITNLEDAPGTEEYTPLVVIMSAGSLTGIRPAEIRVGSHFDSQRRRQHQVPETYTITSL